jgi:recombination protein RecR
MTPAFDSLVQRLRKLPGIGYRSAERIALHLLVEQPGNLPELLEALKEAGSRIRRCEICGNLSEERLCNVCADPGRNAAVVCVVEHVPDLVALERSGSYRGSYHVLHGRLSPIRGVGPGDLNVESLFDRVKQGGVEEVIFALSNDVEGEATCHFLSEKLAAHEIKLTRIGFGLPSGGGVLYADSVTLKNALDARREYL